MLLVDGISLQVRLFVHLNYNWHHTSAIGSIYWSTGFIVSYQFLCILLWHINISMVILQKTMRSLIEGQFIKRDRGQTDF